MSCCGQRRRALDIGPSVVPPPAASFVTRPARFATAPPQDVRVRLRYRGIGPFTTRGAHTGRLYACGSSGAILDVEQRDVEALLHTRRFSRA
jgi:hypothetical protein